MKFDFSAYRHLLSLNAIPDAIRMLRKDAPSGFEACASDIERQWSAWQRTRRWHIFRKTRADKHHEAIIHNLYRAGWHAARGEAPPTLTQTSPWVEIGLKYLWSALVVAAIPITWILLNRQPVCPSFEDDKSVRIIVDRLTPTQPDLLDKLGLRPPTLEKSIRNKLSLASTSTFVHPVNVANADQARAACQTCGAHMIIYGEADTRQRDQAHLAHYLENEEYRSYRLSLGIPEAEATSANFFDLEVKHQWVDDVTCVIYLFEGLLAKEVFQKSTDSLARREAIEKAQEVFTRLAACDTHDSMRVFALHCLAWAQLKQAQDSAALATYNQILEIRAHDPLALNNSARLYQLIGNPLYADVRYEKLLTQHDQPYIRVARAEVLRDLHRDDEARRQLEVVRESEAYRKYTPQFEKRMEHIRPAAIGPGGSISATPSQTLSDLVGLYNQGDVRSSIRGLDSLSAHLDTNRFTREDVSIMLQLYRQAGADRKADQLQSRLNSLGTQPAATSTLLSRQTLRTQIPR